MPAFPQIEMAAVPYVITVVQLAAVGVGSEAVGCVEVFELVGDGGDVGG